MTISGERTKQLDIFCRVTGFTSDFLSFIDVELIQFFHGALQLYVYNFCLIVTKQGQDNCLEGLTFVITGVLESIDRDDTKILVERYGGKVTSSISKNTSYVVVGRDAGEAKLAKVSFA